MRCGEAFSERAYERMGPPRDHIDLLEAEAENPFQVVQEYWDHLDPVLAGDLLGMWLCFFLCLPMWRANVWVCNYYWKKS